LKQIAIQDANILIDLVKTGLLDHLFALKLRFATTNIILFELNEEQQAELGPYIHSGKLSVIEISDEEMMEIMRLSAEDRLLSEQDCSALYYAIREEAILLTGDKRLRTKAETKGVATRGILWVINQMVEERILTGTQACRYLDELIKANKRLPMEDCLKLKKNWGI
jgi:rRNA-processing protein FCF1